MGESVLNLNLKMKVVLTIFILFSVFAINSGTPILDLGRILGGIGHGNRYGYGNRYGNRWGGNRPGGGRFRRDITKTVLTERYPNEGYFKHYPNGFHAIVKRDAPKIEWQKPDV